MNNSYFSKVTADHLQRRACIYVRQSTTFQVLNNRESTERQYNLRQRALDLGWDQGAVDVIDDDQGSSAASAEHRVGFQRLAGEIVQRQVGIVLMLEVSRIARSCSDWHRLIDICSITKTLIADETGVYEPREPNDRLLLGVKGTLSEAELFTLRTRLYEGRWNKARKGLLGRSIPTGYSLDPNGNWVMDPDLNIQKRISYVFSLFRRYRVARRVIVALKEEKLKIPARTWGGPQHGQIAWKDPSWGAIMRFLQSPEYAGTYVYGKCEYDGSKRYKTGKARPRVRQIEEWPVVIHDHHEAYISWEEFVGNKRQLRQNWFRSMTKGSPKKGAALLQGIVWCGHCGAKMGVNTYSAKEKRRPSYTCTHAYKEGARQTCQTMTSAPIDSTIVSLFLTAMAPAQLEISIKAFEKIKSEKLALKEQWDQQLQQAKYEARLAQRQYDAVDPDNRAVASELERRWNEKLEALRTLERSYEIAISKSKFSLTPQETDGLKSLAKDLPTVWDAATTTDQERKLLLRYAVEEVQLDGVSLPDKIEIRITWRSGAVTTKIIDRIKVGAWAPKTSDIVIDRIRELARDHTVCEIVNALNNEGLTSAQGREFRDHHILYIARRNDIPVTTSATLLSRRVLN